jgi:chromosome segregation ATPase
MDNGIMGVYERLEGVENTVSSGMKELKTQNTQTQQQLNQLNESFEEHKTAMSTQLEKMTSIEALLQKLAANLSNTKQNTNE